jgi:hypothetical protein
MKTTYEELAELIAHRLVENVSTRDLEQYYFDAQLDYYENDATDEELAEIAVDLGIIDEDETVEFE